MTDGTESQNLSESVEEIKMKLDTMKQLMEDGINEERIRQRRKMENFRASIIDGNFLSMVFVVVLVLIISVSIYAFFNLFVAIKKKYPEEHYEL